VQSLEYETTSTRVTPNLRWWICGVLFLATTANYIDRQVIGVLKPTLQQELHWSETDYSNIVFWFQVAYAGGYLFAGRLIDRIGLRIGYTAAIFLWSIAAMSHAVVRSVIGFSTARFGLGLAEGGNFPAAIKAVSEWFPKKERAFATGLFNAGCNVGAIITPLLVPWITVTIGWQWAFLMTGAIGFVCVIAWVLIYRPPEAHPNLSADELAYIQSDPPDPPSEISWSALLGYRSTWAFIVGQSMSSPFWWFYLFWIPGFLHDRYGVNLLQMGPPLVVIYLISDLGSIAGGWLSSFLIKRGWDCAPARRFALLICALFVVPVFFTSMAPNVWVATLLISLAASGHQAWAANNYTLVSDTMPRRTVSSIVGIGGFAGALAGMFFAKFVGYVLDWTHSYTLLFALAPASYLIAWAAIEMLRTPDNSAEAL
jgi:ACS family hexuronate transporter-like MFS transporter